MRPKCVFQTRHPLLKQSFNFPSVEKLQVSKYVHVWAALTPNVLGWEGFQAGFESLRGTTRGRSGFVGRGGGKYNLDNRTKRVAVTGDLSNEKDEALRQYLLVIV